MRSLIVVASLAALFAISNSTSGNAASANQRANVSYARHPTSRRCRGRRSPCRRTAFARNAASCGAGRWSGSKPLTVDWATDCDPGRRPYCAMRAGSRRPRTAATNPSRASAKASPRGSSTCRARKNPVSAKPSAMSSSDGVTVVRQERRQPEQPVLPGRGRGARHRAAGLRRHIAQVILGAGRGAACEVEAKAQLDQHLQFETHHLQPGRHRIVEMLKHRGQMIVHLRMRIALRQQPAQRAKMRDAIDHMRRRKLRRAMQAQRLDRRNCRDARRDARARPPARCCRAAAPDAAACRRRREPGRDGGHDRASSPRRWRWPRRGAACPARCRHRSIP